MVRACGWKGALLLLLIFGICHDGRVSAQCNAAGTCSSSTFSGSNCTLSGTFYARLIPDAGCGLCRTVNNYSPGTFFRMPVLSGGCYSISSCGSPVSTLLTAYDSGGAIFSQSNGNGPDCSGSRASIEFVPIFTGDARVDVRENSCANAGGSSSVTLYLRQNNNLQITSSASDMCEGQTRTLTATPARVSGSLPTGAGDAGTFTGTGVTGTTFTAPVQAASSQSYTITYTFDHCSVSQNILVFKQPAAANAGADQAICTNSTTLNAVPNTSGVGTWVLTSGSGTITSPNLPNSTVTGLGLGANVFTWFVGHGACTTTSDAVTITVSAPQSAANAGPDQNVCGATTTVLNANTPVTGAGTWTIISGAGGTLSSATNPNATFTGVTGTNYTLRWSIALSPCATSTDDVNINLLPGATVANAGTDQTVCATSTTLAGNIPTVGTGTWSIVSGGGGNILTPTIPSSIFTGTPGVTYTLRWTITSPPCPPTDDLVTVLFTNPATASNAGPDQVVCDSVAILNANVPTSGTGVWSRVFGAGTIVTPTNPSTAVVGLDPGPNFFHWTITNGACPPSIDEVRITRSVPPDPANAGPDFSVCTDTTFLSATPPVAGTGLWTVVSGPGILMTPTLETSGVRGLVVGSPTTLRWTVTNPPCAPVTDDVIVTRLPSPTSNAGPDIAVCGNTTNLAATAPAVGTGTWTLGGGAGTIVAPTLNSSSVTGLGVGSNFFVWTVSNGLCPDAVDQVQVTQVAPPTPASAGTDQTTCATSVTLSGNIPAAGAGTWTLVSGTGTITNPTSPTTNVTGLGNGPNVFRWTIANAPCTPSTDDVTITRNATAPIANAGPDQTVCDSMATLSGNAPLPGAGAWTRILGAGTIVSPTNNVSPVSGLAIGDNYFQWSVTDAFCGATNDAVLIRRIAPPSAANAGTDQSVCGASTTLAATAPAIGTGTWSIVSGPGAITNAALPNSTLTGLVAGTPTTLRWTVANAPCTATTDDVIITRISTSPAANAGPNQTICGSTATLAGNSASPGTGTWTLVSGTGTILQSNNPSSVVIGLGTGDNYFQWSITDSICPATTAIVRITVTPPPTVANAGADQDVCDTTATLAGNTPVVGTGTWSLISGTGTVTNANSPTSPVTGLGSGPNVFRWTIANAPCTASTDDVVLTRITTSPLANAGPNQAVCGITTILAGNNASPGVGTWTLVSGTGTIISPNNPASIVTNLGLGDNYFQWSVTDSVCPASVSVVRIHRDTLPTVADAGPDQLVCAATATFAGNVPSTGTGTWTLVSGTGVPANINLATSNVSGLATGNNIFRWTISNGACPSSVDDVLITRLGTAPVANAGADQLICDSTTVLIGNSPGTGATGTWTLVFGSGVILNPNNQATVVTSLGTGDNYFRWTISGGPCPDTDDLVRITRSVSPTIANAGGDQTVCGTTATLQGNQPMVGTGTWTLVSGAGTIVSPTTFNTLVTGLGAGTNFFLWTISNGTCPASTDLVGITREVTPVTANAGPDQTVCATTATLAGNLAPTYGGIWTLVSGSGTVTNPTLPGSNVTSLGVGNNTFRWTVNNGACPSTFDDIIITRNASPTAANAGLDSTICGTTYTLQGNLPGVGTGLWTLVAGGGAVTIPTTYNSGVTSIGLGSNTFRWTISNGACPASIDDVVITRTALPTPSNAGPNQTICDTVTVLNADAPFVGTGMWTLVGGSGTIVNPLQRNTNVTHLGVGTNTFRWTVTNGTCPPSTDDMIVFRYDFPSASFAGADQTICSDTAVLAGNVPAVGAGTWSFATGTGTIAVPTSPTSMVTGLAVGNTTLTWTISNGVCPVRTDNVVITRDALPTVANAGADQAVCGQSATLAANTASVGVGIWTLVGGSGVIANTSNATTTVTNLGLGPNTFRWTISNGVCPPSMDDVVVTRDNTPPVALCRNVTLHLDGAGVAPLSISQVDSSSSDNCAISTMSLNITTFLCAQIGTNAVVLVVTDSNGNAASCTATITVLDSLAPSISCPGAQAVLLNSNCAGALPNYLPLGTTADNCSNPPVFAQSPTGGSAISGTGTLTVTFTSTDGSGNTSTCSFIVTKQDSTAPSVACPIPHYLTLDSSCMVLLPDYRDSTTASDNCTAILTLTQVPAPGTVLTNPGYTNVVITVADSTGNTQSCGFSVLRRDLIAPQIICVDTIRATTDSALCTAVVVYAPPVGTDNCLNPVTTLTSGLGSGGTFAVGAHPEVYTVSDSSGNTATCTTIVVVTDDEPPLFTNCPPNDTVSVGNPGCFQVANWLVPSATDNCVLATLTSNHQPLDTFQVGTTIVNYYAVDAQGNQDTCSFAVTVLDTGNPTIICPPDTAVIPPFWGPTAVVFYPLPSVTDACSPTTATLFSGLAPGATFPAGITVVTYVGSDTSGNTDTCSFRVTVLQKVTVFPACSDFETGPGDWVSGGVNKSWRFGVIPGFPNDSVWTTGMTGNYNNNERSWVQTPTYDLTYLKKPMASFEYLDQTQLGSDGVVLQASTDNGLTWVNVGGLGTGKNWYNTININGQPGVNNPVKVGWSASAPTWTKAAVRLDHYIGAPQVSFRFQFASDGNGTTFGFAFDDFCIQERRQNVIHEHFVNDLVPGSLNTQSDLYELINQNQLDAFLVEYHLGDHLALPQAPARANYYQFATTPWMYVEGTRFAGVPSNAHWNQDSLYHRIFEDPLFVFDTLHFDPSFPGGVISPTAQVRYVGGGIFGDSLSLHMAIVERVLTSGGHHHEWVMRQLIPLATGTNIVKQWRLDTIAVVSNSWPLQGVVSNTEVGVVAFLQNKYNKRIYQAEYFGAASPTVGGAEAESVEGPRVSIYPNPLAVGAGQYTLHVESEEQGSVTYWLVNSMGQEVAKGSAATGRFEVDLRELPAGTYFLRLQSRKLNGSHKVVVLGE